VTAPPGLLKANDMKIKLLVARSGADGAHNRGDVIEVSAAEALRMIAADQAVELAAKPERATKAVTREKAIKR